MNSESTKDSAFIPITYELLAPTVNDFHPFLQQDQGIFIPEQPGSAFFCAGGQSGDHGINSRSITNLMRQQRSESAA
ncbi:hypothetical protein KR52_10855 [Synechococcus sp. KORDI-52]|uniref:hypothetical protein n=1 Tax=Synechococcus sp. KORDI-52 TaxID=585425 RepID=UPI0004E068F4|nr:hypothetical protein [Synechococcus sp. KORDI-52]AII49638.1 hypothetical protein KR52_10855 [Synechococcus sp. KORDI-52]